MDLQAFDLLNFFTNTKKHCHNSSLPILREFGLQRESTSLLHDASTLSMLKIWIGLELRYLMSSSAKKIFDLVKSDQLCPNY